MNRFRLWRAGFMLAALAAKAMAVEPDAAPAAAAGAPFDLVAESEAGVWNSSSPGSLPGAVPKESVDFKTPDLNEDVSTPTCRSTANNDADNPKIRVLSPVLERPLLMPIDIELQFVPVGSTPIRPETFRVCYVGLLTMDITKRLTDKAPVTAQGLRVMGARLPRGHHRFLLLIADRHGRLARHEAIFNVL